MTDSPDAESFALLRASAVFDGVDDGQLAQIDACLRPVSFAASEAIVRVGEPADRWYVIVCATIWRERAAGWWRQPRPSRSALLSALWSRPQAHQ